jgi:hypothetical protein
MSAVEELPPGIHVVGDDHVKVYDLWIEVPYSIPVWESGQSYTYKRSSRLKDDLQFRGCMGFRDKTESVLTHLPGEQYNTDVPFEHGVVSFAVEDPKDEYVEIVREFTRAVSLGYLRFLDFQKLEEQAEQAQHERAVERVRAEVMAMRNSDDLLKIVGAVKREMNEIGIETERCFIDFVDEDAENVHSYQALVNPRTANITWTSSELVEIDDQVVVVLIDIAYDTLAGSWIEKWKSDRAWTEPSHSSPKMPEWFTTK